MGVKANVKAKAEDALTSREPYKLAILEWRQGQNLDDFTKLRRCSNHVRERPVAFCAFAQLKALRSRRRHGGNTRQF